jgi:hypothetical protein
MTAAKTMNELIREASGRGDLEPAPSEEERPGSFGGGVGGAAGPPRWRRASGNDAINARLRAGAALVRFGVHGVNLNDVDDLFRA